MKRQFWILAAAAAFAAAPVWAQTPSDESIAKLQQIMLSEKQFNEMSSTMSGQIEKMLNIAFADNSRTDLTPQQNAAVRKAVLDFIKTQNADLLGNQQIREQVIAAWAASAKEHFTQQEVDAQIAFYSSPEGKSVLTKMPLMVQSYMHRMMPVMQQQIAKAAKEAQSELLPKIKKIVGKK